MRETYSLRCRLVDHALALPGENKCRVVVRALAKGDGVSQSIGESYDEVERCLDVDRSTSDMSRQYILCWAVCEDLS
jgi:hypothetical protein